MAYPQLRIRLISNGRILFSTRGSGDRLQTIAAVDGSERTRHLLPVQADERGLSLRGYISDLEESRSTRRYQTYFVNGRAVDSKVMERAVSQAYGNRLPHGRSPIVYLFLHVDPAVLDVNIHPNKRQVRFDDEVTITAFIRNAVAAALTVPDAMPSVQVEAEKLPGRAQGEQLSLGGRGAGRGRGGRALRRDAVAAAPNPQGRSDSDAGTVRDAEREHVNGAAAAQGPSGSANAPDRDSPRNEETAASQQDSPQHEPDPAAAPGPGGTQEAQPASSLQGSPQGEADAVAAALDAYRSERDGAAALHDPETPYAGTAGAGESMRFSDLEIRGAAFNTYIIAEREDRLYLIDQHAAHERVNFERLMRQLETADGASQLLLLPQTVEVSFSDEERLEPLRQIGYRLEEFGPHTWRVREIPAQMEEAEADAFLREYLDGAGEEDDWHSRTLLEKAAMRACKASVKAHDRLSEAEIRRLLHDLDRCRQPFSCPHGRPTCVLLSRQEIEKRFGRT
ncbi:MAG: DNA mismatch repair endonuclease MutL [Anaerovoracaceae bacterium]